MLQLQKMDDNGRLWLLMARALSGEATAQEQQELSLLVQQHPDAQQQYELLTRMWHHDGQLNTTEQVTDQEKQELQRILDRARQEAANPDNYDTTIDAQEENETKPVYRLRPLSIAATVLLAIVAIWLYVRKENKQNHINTPEPSQTLASEKGSRLRNLLPDGTVVWLNAGSKLTYKNDFNQHTREVVLEGEAYFNVKRNTGKPFIVHTGGVNIKVLGTIFNVKSYAADENVETTLLHGSVEVTGPKGGHNEKPIILKPLQKLTVHKQANGTSDVATGKAATVISVKPYALEILDSTIKDNQRFEIAWLYNRLEFRGDDFETLAAKIERWYNVSITFENNEVKKLKFNGSFENETVEQALDALKEVSNFSYTIKNNKVTIR
jgi:ferric-dicitrate binding protein FerR (iron transport regulator)